MLPCRAEFQDPTRPIDYSGGKKAAKGLVLSAVLLSPQRVIAIINGKPVKVGDHVDGFEVLEINRNSVLIRGSSGVRQIPLLHNWFKKPVN